MSAKDELKIRYAVVGLGWIAQAAMLPAFDHAKENSELVALVSDDPVKLKELGEKYRVKHTFTYEQYDECLRSGLIDAVYIALPNTLHAQYTIRAAEAGIHVLSEKPMADSVEACLQMIRAAEQNAVKLMIAYRLHFEEAHLKAVEIARSGEIGDLRIFNSVNSEKVEAGNIRLDAERGGGPLEDIGIYCINAARYLFRDEPTEVMAFGDSNGEPEFDEVGETISVMMRFPGGRLATFACGFSTSRVEYIHLAGTKGDLRVDPAFSFDKDLKHTLTVEGKSKETKFAKRDQFAPQLLYFSDCILNDKTPEPSGQEGLIDLQIIEALHRSIETHQPVTLDLPSKSRPSMQQEIHRPPVREPELIHASTPEDKDQAQNS